MFSSIKEKKLIPTYFFCSIYFLLGFFALPALTNAADLFFTPPSGVYEVGDEVLVKVMLNPKEYSVNAAEGEILIPQGLEVKTVSTERSVFSIWTEEPNLSVQGDKIFFSGGRASPISGNSEELFSVVLVSSVPEIQRLRIDSGAIMAADGAGTNVISGLISGVYTFVVSPEESEPEPEYLASPGSPEKPDVHSLTHPEEEDWYSEGDVSFSWDLPQDVMEIRVELNQRAYSIPNDIRMDAVGEIEFKDTVDGVWYFHLQTRNEEGWSPVSTRKVQIDSTPPETFWVNKLERKDFTDPNIELNLQAEDAVSGIDEFYVFVNGIYEESFDGSLREIVAGPLPPGIHSVLIRAKDKAGNSRTESLSVEVGPIEGVVFTEVPNIIHSGSIMALRGKGLPNAFVILSVQIKGEEPEAYKVETDSDGHFTFVAPEKPSDGLYTVKAKSVDERGAESLYNDEVTIAVQPPGVVRLGAMAVDGLSVLISLLAMIVLLIVAVYWGRHKWTMFRRSLNKEIREAEEEVHVTFENLRQKRQYQISLLNEAEKKRDLTEEEIKIKEQIQEDIDSLGVSAEKEVHDIKEAFDR